MSAPGKLTDCSYFGERNPNPVTGLVMCSPTVTFNSLDTKLGRQRSCVAQRAHPIKSNSQAPPWNTFRGSEKSGSARFNWKGEMVSRHGGGPRRTSPTGTSPGADSSGWLRTTAGLRHTLAPRSPTPDKCSSGSCCGLRLRSLVLWTWCIHLHVRWDVEQGRS